MNRQLLATVMEKFPDLPVVFITGDGRGLAGVGGVTVGAVIEYAGKRYLHKAQFYRDYYNVNHVWLKKQTGFGENGENEVQAWNRILIHMNGEAQRHMKDAIIVALA